MYNIYVCDGQSITIYIMTFVYILEGEENGYIFISLFY